MAAKAKPEATTRSAAHTRLAIEHAVAGVLEQSESIEQAAPELIAAICGILGWSGGARWTLEAGGGLPRRAEAWGASLPGADAHSTDLIRRAWAEAKPIRQRNVFASPITTEAGVVGVMEFFSPHMQEPQGELLDCMGYVGGRIGKFVQHRNAREVLRESEGRFRSLVQLSSDFYWETDAEHRLVQTDYNRQAVVPSGRRFGMTRWEVPSTRPDAAGWAAHRATMDAHLPFRDFEYARLDDEGIERHLLISGEPLFDTQGRFKGYRGMGKDITPRKREEQVLKLEHAVARCLSDAQTPGAAIQEVLRALCESQNWELGRYFVVDEEAQVLRFEQAWAVPEAGLERYVARFREMTYVRGTGLVGLAWQAGEPQWAEDLNTDVRASRRIVSTEAGMRGCLAFPVGIAGKVTGVLVFNSRKVRKPDERLLSAAKVIAGQIGQLLERKKAEDVLRESEERFRGLTKLSADWFWEQDAELRFVDMTLRLKNKPGLKPSAMAGKKRWDFAADNMSEADWAAHRAVLEARQPFHGLELRRTGADGNEVWVSISGEPIFDVKGVFRGYRGVTTDISARKREEKLAGLEHSTTRSIAEAQSASEAVEAVIRILCEAEGWECGRYFRVDRRAGLLRFAAAWGVADPDIERYIAASRQVTYAPGTGMTGKVWQSGVPMWVSEGGAHAGVSQAILGRPRDVLIFPLLAHRETIGVMTFTSRKLRRPDERLLRAVGVIGRQTGQFLQRKEAEEALRESEERFQTMIELAAVGIAQVGAEGRFLLVNRRLCEILGYTREELLRLTTKQISHPDDVHLSSARQVELRAGKINAFEVQKRYLRKDGSTIWMAVSIALHRDAAGEHLFDISVFEDISARKQAEEELRRSEERFRSLTALSSDMFWEQDAEFRFTSFTGVGAGKLEEGRIASIIGNKRWEQAYVNMSADDWARHMEDLRAHKPFRDLELCRLDSSGKKVWFSVSGEPLFGADGEFKGYRGVGKDITARKLGEERIQYLANHDRLTGLANRSMFSELLSVSLEGARRYQRSFAVLFIDLDRFKVINDTLGHEAGDELLKEVAERLRSTIRSSDIVARFGGDEFVVLVQEVSEAKQVEIVARKILSALLKPLVVQGHEYRVTASIGICMYPGDAQDAQALLKNADIAMYHAKDEGKNTFKFYSAESNAHSFEKLALETSLRRAMERNELFLHYQAKLDLHTRQVTGVEALLRWKHPELGMVSPAQFIPLAEETGLIVPIGKWVLNTACAQNVAWQHDGLSPVRISVNLSARQFDDENLLQDIGEALQASGLRPELLELEITESMVMRNTERASRVLEAVKKMGVRLAIDDFGVGYSSLTHLKRFPIDTLKVDRSFIRDIPQDGDDKAITEAIIAMGKSLNLTVVAEGVETLEQQNFLEEHDCDEIQGYYFSRPGSQEQFAALLRQRLKDSDQQLPAA